MKPECEAVNLPTLIISGPHNLHTYMQVNRVVSFTGLLLAYRNLRAAAGGSGTGPLPGSYDRGIGLLARVINVYTRLACAAALTAH